MSPLERLVGPGYVQIVGFSLWIGFLGGLAVGLFVNWILGLRERAAERHRLAIRRAQLRQEGCARHLANAMFREDEPAP